MLSGTGNPGAKASCRSLNPFICSYLALGTVKDGLELLSLCRLSREEEGLRVRPLAADLERTEVPVPEPVRSLGLGLSPQLQLIVLAAARTGGRMAVMSG